MKVAAQFLPASASESVVFSPAFVRNTGDDIIDDGSDIYAVSVWDDGASLNPGMSYEVKNGSGVFTGTVSFFSNDVLDPDVCLVKDQTTNQITAVCVYYELTTGGTYFIQSFYWDNSLNQFLAGDLNQFYLGSRYGYSLNIDGNDNGEFAVVWDDVNNAIYAMAGEMKSGNGSFFPNNFLWFSVGFVGTAPDVAIGFDGTDYIVYVTFIETSNGNLYVISDDLGNVISGPFGGSINFQTSPPLGEYFVPRIACPNTSITSENWAVVLEERTLANFYIAGFVCDNSNVVSYYYNDGSNSPYLDISNVQNMHPVVSYDYQTNIWIGWVYDNGSGIFTSGGFGASCAATYPVMLKADIDGQVNGSIPVNDYWEVPTIFANGDYIDLLSVAAGRHCSNTDQMYLAYMDANNLWVTTKMVTANAIASLRTHANLTTSANNELVNVYVYDLTGRLNYYLTTNSSDLEREISNYLLTAPAAPYLLKTNNVSGTANTTRKIINLK
jgi:hypothetical protein